MGIGVVNGCYSTMREGPCAPATDQLARLCQPWADESVVAQSNEQQQNKEPQKKKKKENEPACMTFWTLVLIGLFQSRVLLLCWLECAL